MVMEGLRPSLLAALLFLTLVVLAASASGGSGGGGGDNVAAAAAAVEEHDDPLADEPYMLVAFHNKDGEEIRILSDKGTETLSPSGFANRSGHLFYRIRELAGKGSGKRRRRRLPLPHQSISNNMSRRESPAENFWNELALLASSGDPDPPATDDEQEGYVLVGMETSGGHMIRLVVVADQRYFFITGFAQGFFRPRHWSFRDDGERHRLLTTLGGGNGAGGSHAEVVASNVLAMMKDGRKAYYS